MPAPRVFQSTHPRGVRLDVLVGRVLDGVSIHAPARGATRINSGCRGKTCGFNPRTREGCDFCKSPRSAEHVVSIHAPARGATEGCYDSNENRNVSIHAPARGATSCAPHTPITLRFQSTHPRGVRLDHPTAPLFPGVSIHAPARGATCFGSQNKRFSLVSIHAPARGATRYDFL